MKIDFKKILVWLKPVLIIGGLDISDTALRYLAWQGEKIITASLQLPRGIIQEGEVRDKQQLIQALVSLRRQIDKTNKPQQVIVSISGASVYTQLFSLPLIVREKIEEAARLNLEMISPIDVKDSYYDWQIAGEGVSEGKMELFGSFANARVVDDLSEALATAGFVVMAIEPTALSISRAAGTLLGEHVSGPHMLFSLSGDGLEFMILRNGNLYFNNFISWRTLQEKVGSETIGAERLRNFIVVEVQRLINFYTSRWGERVKDIVVASGMPSKEVAEDLKNNFDISVEELSLSGYSGLSANWLVALGAALRGKVSRGKDIFISLARVGTEEMYRRERIIVFSGFWRNVAIAVTAAIFLLFIGLDLSSIFYLNNIINQIAEAPAGFLNEEELGLLNKKAAEFNGLIDKAAMAKEASVAWEPLFRRLDLLIGPLIEFEQVQLSSGEMPKISIKARARSERAVIDFKNRLLAEKNIEAVSLPLTAIIVTPEGSAQFNVSFRLKKWPEEQGLGIRR